MSDELLNIFNDGLELIGSAPRSEAHRLGLLHDVVHCWVADPDGRRLFFQRRAMSKDTYPGYYDLAVGGHICAGEAPLEAVLREMREEIGLSPAPEALIFAGSERKPEYYCGHVDREIARIFLLRDSSPVFRPGAEVDDIVWIYTDDYVRRFELPALTAHSLFAGGEVAISPGMWAGPPSHEFEDFILLFLGARE